MDKRQKVAVIFSTLSFAVVLANLSVGIWIYIPILVLCVVSYFIKAEYALWLQVSAVVLIGIFISVFEDEYCGYVILFTALMLMFSNKSKYMPHYILCFMTIVIILSYFTVETTRNRIIHALLDGGLFGAYACVIWIIFSDALNSLHKKEEEYRSRYMHILEEATAVAREALTRLEKIREENKNE